MSTDLAVRASEQQMTVLTNDQLTYIAGTEFVPPGLRGNLPAILACVATGRALGIADMTALRSIHIIDGKATFSAELMVQLVRRNGHSITGEVTAGSATVTGTRKDNGDAMASTWTLEMADRAGLLGKSNWKKYPEAMLWARAASQLCRMLFADCFAGATYTTEELGDEDTTATAAPAPDMYDPALPFGDYPHEQLLPPASAGEPKAKREPAEASTSVSESPVSQAAVVTAEPASPAELPQGWKDAAEQKRYGKKLDVLVAKLRPDHVSTLQLWEGMGRSPVTGIVGEPDDGILHWRRLRNGLTKAEASELIDRLAAKVGKLEAAADGNYFANRAAEVQGKLT